MESTKWMRCNGKFSKLKYPNKLNENLGMNTLVHGRLQGRSAHDAQITCKLRGWCDYKRGDEVNVQFVKRHFFDKETTNAIR